MFVGGLEVVPFHEDWIRSADLDSDAVCEWLDEDKRSKWEDRVQGKCAYEETYVEVVWPPTEDHSVECDYQSFESAFFRSLEQRKGDFICTRPCEGFVSVKITSRRMIPTSRVDTISNRPHSLLQLLLWIARMLCSI